MSSTQPPIPSQLLVSKREPGAYYPYKVVNMFQAEVPVEGSKKKIVRWYATVQWWGFSRKHCSEEPAGFFFSEGQGEMMENFLLRHIAKDEDDPTEKELKKVEGIMTQVKKEVEDWDGEEKGSEKEVALRGLRCSIIKDGHELDVVHLPNFSKMLLTTRLHQQGMMGCLINHHPYEYHYEDGKVWHGGVRRDRKCVGEIMVNLNRDIGEGVFSEGRDGFEPLRNFATEYPAEQFDSDPANAGLYAIYPADYPTRRVDAGEGFEIDWAQGRDVVGGRIAAVVAEVRNEGVERKIRETQAILLETDELGEHAVPTQSMGMAFLIDRWVRVIRFWSWASYRWEDERISPLVGSIVHESAGWIAAIIHSGDPAAAFLCLQMRMIHVGLDVYQSDVDASVQTAFTSITNLVIACAHSEYIALRSPKPESSVSLRRATVHAWRCLLADAYWDVCACYGCNVPMWNVSELKRMTKHERARETMSTRVPTPREGSSMYLAFNDETKTRKHPLFPCTSTLMNREPTLTGLIFLLSNAQPAHLRCKSRSGKVQAGIYVPMDFSRNRIETGRPVEVMKGGERYVDSDSDSSDDERRPEVEMVAHMTKRKRQTKVPRGGYAEM